MRPIPPAAPPSSTYRLQINSEFTFADAAELCSYLGDLGVSHIYLSPILQAVPGSAHGYDVLDHSQVSADAGGRAGLDALAAAAHEQGLKLIADVVPNHMAVPVPESQNRVLWSVLRDGPESDHANWLDIDWGAGQLVMPVLGSPIGAVLANRELTLDTSGDEPVLRYYEHAFPVREGTSELPLPELLAAQHYRLTWWRAGDEILNYRRFFDVTSLAGIRVEDAEVFDVSHALIADLVHEGVLDGLRIDHPDGLADPQDYLRRLGIATDHAWVVVEKILEGDEALDPEWVCAGTTGYDALNVIGGLFVDPSGQLPLARLALPPHRIDDQRIRDLDDLRHELVLAEWSAKQLITDRVLVAEIDRLERLLVRIGASDPELMDHTPQSWRTALSMLLRSMDRYRAYAIPGREVPAESAAVIGAAAWRARERMTDPQHLSALDAVARLALSTDSQDPLVAEFVVRFQQTCGPVMAKAIEDTLFYRWLPLLALNEVGADPHRFGHSPAEFHAYCAQRLHDWPATMTTLSTHDTKRSEDARARLYTLSEVPHEWATAVHEWSIAVRDLGVEHVHQEVAYLLWQTLVAVWTPAGAPDTGRIVEYLRKALREAKSSTTWISPNDEYEDAATALVQAVLGSPHLVASIEALVGRLAAGDRANVLGQKLIQLTMPGVPDVYQGCELADRHLVDPDNRQPVDFARRRALLADLDDTLDSEKLRLTTQALNLRRAHRDWFGDSSSYVPIASSSDHVVAFGRGTSGDPEVITVATRLALRLEAAGGWGTATLDLPAHGWRDLLTGHEFSGGATSLADLLSDQPVALLVRV